MTTHRHETTSMSCAGRAAWLLAAVMLARGAFAQDCCDGAELPDGEPCGFNENGGCNQTPQLFVEASCGETYCGTAWAEGGGRDTDWYRVAIDRTGGLAGTLWSQFDGVVFVVDGIPACNPVVVGRIGSSNDCAPGTASAALPAGTYVVFAATANFDGTPCGAGDDRYRLLIECEDAPGCPGEGGCFEPHGGPGCNEDACCHAVCGRDPACCEAGWDEPCVRIALDMCGDPSCGPGAGGCGAANGSPGCDDASCCNLVCLSDPSCCDDDWDEGCAGAAIEAGCATPPPLHKLLPEDGTFDDLFGRAVAIDGAVAIVGADWDDDNGSFSGSAYLFDVSSGEQIAKLLASDGAERDFFGGAVGVSGSRAIVGAHWNDDNGSRSGSAYLFDVRTGAQVAKLLPADNEAGDEFGASVGISGAVVIVGASRDGDNGFFSGSAYLFDATGGDQIAKLVPEDNASGDEFGGAVAISGSIAIVGAVGDDDNGPGSGSAYLFDVATGRQIFKLLPDDGVTQASFGSAVAIDGGTAIVGMPFNSAYLFDTRTGRQIAEIGPDDGAAFDLFGFSVGVSGAVAIVGAYRHDDNGLDSGAAYLFDARSGRQTAELLADDGAMFDRFGYSVGISGPVAVAGAFADDDNGSGSGSAYLFRAGDGRCPGDTDGDGQVDVDDLVAVILDWGGDGSAHGGDVDGSGAVDVDDLTLVVASWGPCA